MLNVHFVMFASLRLVCSKSVVEDKSAFCYLVAAATLNSRDMKDHRAEEQSTVAVLTYSTELL